MKTKRISVMQFIGLVLLAVLAGRDSLATEVRGYERRRTWSIEPYTETAPDVVAWIDADLRFYRAELARLPSQLRREGLSSELSAIAWHTREHIAQLVDIRKELVRAQANLEVDYRVTEWRGMSRAQRARSCNERYSPLSYLNRSIEGTRRLIRGLDQTKARLNQLQRQISSDRSLDLGGRDSLMWMIRSAQLEALDFASNEYAHDLPLEQMLECRRYVTERGPESCPPALTSLQETQRSLRSNELRQTSEEAPRRVVRAEEQLRGAQGEGERFRAYQELANAVIETTASATGRGPSYKLLQSLIGDELDTYLLSLCRSQGAAPAAAQSDRTVRGGEQETATEESTPGAASAGAANPSQ